MATLFTPESCGTRGYGVPASKGPVGAGWPVGKGGKHVWVKINGKDVLVVKTHQIIHEGK